MRASAPGRSLALKGLIAALALLAAGPALAVEPLDEFVEALCQRHMYDEAIGYLRSQSRNESLPADVKAMLPYEHGLVLMRSAGQLADPAVKQNQLEQAERQFQDFVKASPNHELAGSARNQLATVMVERARSRITLARQSKSIALMPEARRTLLEAQEQFKRAEKEFETRLREIPPQPDDPRLKQRRSRIFGDLAEARLMGASVGLEVARTMESGSFEAREQYEAAAKAFAGLHEAYRSVPAGLYACLWEGQCYQELGDMKKAVGCFQELMNLDVDEKRSANKQIVRLKAKGYRQAMECWTSSKDPQYLAAIDHGEQWASEFATGLERDPDNIAIRYLTALAYSQAAQALREQKDPSYGKYISGARHHAERLTRFASEHREPARKLLASLARTAPKDEAVEPKTFADAVARAKQALAEIEATDFTLDVAKSGEDEAATAKAKRRRAVQREIALRYFKLALRLADAETPAEDRNAVRYYLSYLNWDAGRFHEAAVTGEFLARRYPKSPHGRNGARVALAAYTQLYRSAIGGEKSFETRHVTELADLINKQWPDQPEAEEATLTLLALAIQRGDFAQALEKKNAIPEKSLQRGRAELQVGQALWTAYLQAIRKPVAERGPVGELNQRKEQARAMLEAGVGRLKARKAVAVDLIAGMLSLAQIYVETGEPLKAVTLLEDPNAGPLKLVEARDAAATTNPAIPVETYKIALRAYVAARKVREAERTMNTLEKLIGSDAKAGETLTLIYVSLGRSLQQQLQDLRESGKKKEMQSVSKSFETFLSRILERKQGVTFSSLNWVADTFYSLGSGFDDGQAPSEEAKQYYQRAVKAYERLLQMAKGDKKFAPSRESLIGVKLRLAVSLRKSGQFDQSIAQIADVLRDHPTTLAAQVEGAATYQAKGKVDPLGYVKAVKGGEPDMDRKNRIWGWAKLANLTSKNPKFEPTFHQARLNLATCRYELSLVEKENKRRQYAEVAKRDLWLTYKLYPKLGGERSSQAYDSLLKKIQAALGENPTGLEEFRSRGAQASAAK